MIFLDFSWTSPFQWFFSTFFYSPSIALRQSIDWQPYLSILSFPIRSSSLANSASASLSETLFYQMLFSAVELAALIFTLDDTQGLSPTNITAVFGAATILVPTYLFCKFSENVTVCLEAIGDIFYRCSWYCATAAQRKMFLMAIQQAQMKFRMNGLGIVDCSLEIFLRVRWRFSLLIYAAWF